MRSAAKAADLFRCKTVLILLGFELVLVVALDDIYVYIYIYIHIYIYI